MDGSDAAAGGGAVWSFAYDEFGNVVKETNPNGGVMQYQYDALGRRTQEEWSDGSKEQTAYVDVGVGGALEVEQTWVTDRRGATTISTADYMDRLWMKQLPGVNAGDPAMTVETYYYTPAGQVSLVTVATNGVTNRLTYYDYDGVNRLIDKDCPEGVVIYTWTVDNHLATMSGYRRGVVSLNGPITNGTPVDVSLAYGYDYAGRVASVTNAGALAANYSYDNVGNLASWTGTGVLTNTMYYTAQNRLTNLNVVSAGKLARGYTYGLGKTGARTNVTELQQTTGSPALRWAANWEYDGHYGTNPVPAKAYRLTRETLTNASGWAGAITNVYDPNGNRVSRNVGLAITPVEALTNQSLRYDRRDLIYTGTNGNNSANTNYDGNGNTVVDNGAPTGDRYDAENRLIGRGTTITIAYDQDGNRVSKTVNGVTTYYLVDDQNPSGYAQVMAEYANPTTAPAVSYAYGLTLLSQDRGGVTSWFAFDGQGNVRMLINSSTTITDTYDYDAFGRLLASSNGYRFASQQWDSDLGLYYMRARFEKTDLGRFWTSDPSKGDVKNPSTLHRYLYCQTDPINLVDPSGLFSQQFGYLAEAAIQAVYAVDHAGDTVQYGQWTRLGGPLSSAYKLKPDIFNTSRKTWAEIKPLTQSGIARALFSEAKYSGAFSTFGYLPDVGWKPSTHSATAGSDPIVFFNAGGIIFYTDATGNLKDLLGLTTVAAARAYFAANPALMQGLIGSLEQIRALVLGAEVAIPAVEGTEIGAEFGLEAVTTL